MEKINSIGMVICESTPEEDSNAKIIEVDGNRALAEGRLQTAEEINRNSRGYERKDLFQEVNNARMKELIDAKQFKGESGHPISSELARQQTIFPSCCCVKYTKVWTEGNDILARFHGTHNHLGDDFDADLRDGSKPAFSLRALGTIENVKGKAYVKNIKIVTWDHVIYPSHPNAYTFGLVKESAEYTPENFSRSRKNILEGNDMYANNGKGLLIPITNDTIVNYIKTESANIKTIIDNFDILYESITPIDNNRNVRLVDKFGNVIIVNLESHIGDEIRNFCSSMTI